MFKKMEYVYTVYREQSFTRAAEKLYISQPALSTAIKRLEEEIGSPLFERRSSGLALTETGKVYLDTAEQIMALEKGFEERVSELRGLRRGSLTVGGSNYVSSYLLPRLVQQFSKKYPGIGISLVESNSLDLTKKLNQGEIDLLIDNVAEQQKYDCRPLFEEKILLAVPAHFKSNQGLEPYRLTPQGIYEGKRQAPPISIRRFKNENFILLKSGNNMHRQAMDIFQKGGIDPKVSFRMDQLITAYALAATGNGVCFVTDTFFKFHRFRDEIFLYYLKGDPGRTLSIARNRARYPTAAITKFIEIADQLKEETPCT